jgi:prepilin-type N-terminal cleavage/methylation domain-containing protein
MRIKRSFKNTTQAGDTLIEVMIAMAIIGLVIAVSYSTANRALQVGRRAQERTEALKEAESQIETLKSIGGLTGANDIFSTIAGGPTDPSFCVSASGIVEQNNVNPDIFASGVNLDVAPVGVPTGAITYNSACVGGIDGRYRKSITRTDFQAGASSPIQSTFTVRVRWFKIGGGLDEVALVYKLNKSQYGK